jgi:hypothetical protein
MSYHILNDGGDAHFSSISFHPDLELQIHYKSKLELDIEPATNSKHPLQVHFGHHCETITWKQFHEEFY